MEPEINSQPIPPTNPQPPIQSTVPEIHKSPVLLWLLILALVSVASYYGYQNWQLRQQVSQNQPTPTSTVTPTIAPNPTANWKTYTNTKYNFLFKHPSNLTIRPFAGSQEEPSEATMFKIDPEIGETVALVSVTSKKTPPTVGLSKGDSINGLDTYYAYHGSGVPSDKTPIILVEIHAKDRSVQFVFRNVQNLDNTANLLLSTFAFTKSVNTGNSDWKTYSNDNAAFSLKIPPNFSELLASEAVVSGPWEANPQLVVSFADKTTLSPGTDKPFNGFSIYEQEVAQLKMKPFSLDTYLNEEIKNVKQSERGIFDAQVVSQTSENVSFSYIDSEANIRRYFTLSQDGKRIMIFATATRSQQFLDLMTQIISTLRF